MSNMKVIKSILIIILLIPLPACSFHFVDRMEPLTETVVSGQGKDKIVLIDISGVISTKTRSGPSLLAQKRPNHVSRVREELNKASSDKRVKGLILRINSPGGGVTASDIIYREIKRFKASKGVPVVACMMDVATSGAYYISMASDTILAHPTTITGGIGVIAFKFNTEGLLQKIGVKDESIKSGDKKDLFSPFRSNTEDEVRILGTIIDNLHGRFIDVIAENRKELAVDEIARLADGRVYTANQAVSLKLIDKIGYIDDAVDVVKKLAGITDEKTVIYHRPFSYRSNIYSSMFHRETGTINLINIDLGSMEEFTGLKLMYLSVQ